MKITAREHRLAAAVAREQLGLAALAARIDLRRVAEAAQLRLESRERGAARGVAGPVDYLLRIIM